MRGFPHPQGEPQSTTVNTTVVRHPCLIMQVGRGNPAGGFMVLLSSQNYQYALAKVQNISLLAFYVRGDDWR